MRDWMGFLGLCGAAAMVPSGCVMSAEEQEMSPAEDEASVFEIESGVSSTCPTAPERASLSLFRWRTSRQLDRFVWSSDGRRIGGVELLFEEKKSGNALNGTTDKRKFCHRVFVQAADGTGKRYVGGMLPNQNGEVSFMSPAGYFVVESFSGAAVEFHRLGLDGKRRALGQIDAPCTTGRVLPSPSGSRMALVSEEANCSSYPDTAGGSRVSVRFLDEQGSPVGTTSSLSFAGFGASTWTPAGALVVSDGAVAFRVDENGAVERTAIPGCTHPATTSSLVAADGRALGLVDGRIGVVEIDPSRAFGCQ